MQNILELADIQVEIDFNISGDSDHLTVHVLDHTHYEPRNITKPISPLN
jgi:hypothetical protein